MSTPQSCKIVLTGGPCAGKTTLTQVIARVFRDRVVVVPEAASLLFSGGFPRWSEAEPRKATQRAIYQVQCELESAFASKYPNKVLVLDRGTVDGAAYWPDGAPDFFRSLETSLEAELSRYRRVIYLESAAPQDYAENIKSNPNRIESWSQACQLDEQTQKLWAAHPHLVMVKNQRSFDAKIAEVLALVDRDVSRVVSG